MSNVSSSEQVKLFAMQNLLLEADLARIEGELLDKGLSIEHTKTLMEPRQLVDEDLFDMDIRSNAQKMAKFYILYFCLENSIRRLIESTLSGKYGSAWWNLKAPAGVKDDVEKLKRAEKDTSMTIRGENSLLYTDLGHLIPIIQSNWGDFSDLFRSQKALEKNLSDLNKVRNVVAHSCTLNDDEIIRFELLIKDWQKRVLL